MIIDSRTEFSDAQDLTSEPATIVATNQVDLQVARDVGNGQPVYVVMTVDTTFTDGGDAATLTVRLISDSTAAMSSPTVHWQSAAFLKADLVAGDRFVWTIPTEGVVFEQFLGVDYVVGTAGFDAGAVSCWLSLDPTGWKAYPDAVN